MFEVCGNLIYMSFQYVIIFRMVRPPVKQIVTSDLKQTFKQETSINRPPPLLDSSLLLCFLKTAPPDEPFVSFYTFPS